MHILSDLARLFYSTQDVQSILVLPWIDASISVFMTNIAYPKTVDICCLWNGRAFQTLESELVKFTAGNYRLSIKKSLREFLLQNKIRFDFVVVEYNIARDELPLLFSAKRLLIVRQGVIYDCTGGANLPSF